MNAVSLLMSAEPVIPERDVRPFSLPTPIDQVRAVTRLGDAGLQRRWVGAIRDAAFSCEPSSLRWVDGRFVMAFADREQLAQLAHERNRS